MFKQYDPGLVDLVIGPYTITGFHSGSFIKCMRTDDTWKLEEGAKGDAVRTRSRKRSGTITFTLQSTSPSNDDLSNLALLDEDEDAQPDPVASGVYDGNSKRTLWEGKESWIVKPADYEAADEHSPREWTVAIAKLKWFNGGSTK